MWGYSGGGPYAAACAARPADHEVMAPFQQAFLRGAAGVVADYAALGQPWGVDLADIEVPLTIFQGDADPMVPLRHAEELAKRVPAARLTVWEGAGHLGPIAHVGEVLDALR